MLLRDGAQTGATEKKWSNVVPSSAKDWTLGICARESPYIGIKRDWSSHTSQTTEDVKDIIGLRFCLVRKLTSHENPTQSEASSKGMGPHSFLNRVVLAFALVFFSFHLLQAQIRVQTLCGERRKPPSCSRGKDVQNPCGGEGVRRFLGYARDLSHHHGDSNTPLVLRADDEFNAPNLNVNVTVRPTDESFLALQLLTFDPFSGMDVDDRIFRLSRQGLVLTAGTLKDYGQFNCHMVAPIRGTWRLFDEFAKQVQNSLFDRMHGPTSGRLVFSMRIITAGPITCGRWILEKTIQRFAMVCKRLARSDECRPCVGRTPFNIVNLPDHIVAGRIAKKHCLQRFELGGMRSRGLDAWTNGESYGMTALSAAHKGKLGALSLKTDLAWGVMKSHLRECVKEVSRFKRIWVCLEDGLVFH